MPTIFKNSRAYGETAVYGGFTPVGTIISVMGNDAPTNYLKCDGSLYSISAYPELAAHFKDQFGSINYFGGNGTTTFGVPDLRGEFLRGAGTNSHTDQGDGAAVGTHQDGTEHARSTLVSSNGDFYVYTDGRQYMTTEKYDSTVGTTTKQSRITGTLSNVTQFNTYTSRPTNTSVLYCIAYKNIYIETSGGGSGTGGSEVYETTATLDEDIDDTTTVLAADLPGVDFDDILINVTLIRDAKGTLGLVTAKNGTTDVTVTTINTTTSTKELTQAQYDLLPTSEKNNGTTYYITDSFAGGTYVGAYETIYSTTEHVVGSYMGKPLYQKIVDFGQIPSGRWPSSTAAMSSGLTGVERFFIKSLYTTSGAILPYERVTIGESDGISIVSCAYIENGTPVIKISTDTDRSAMGHVFGILQYTKTTDITSPVEYASPNDYSTSEKIVGTWIDGRPIYQKTIDLGTELLPGASSTLLVPSVISSNLDNTMDVIDCTITMITANAHGNNPCELYRSGSSWYWRCLESWSAGGSGNSYLTVKYIKSST